jgi:hypothetical protein
MKQVAQQTKTKQPVLLKLHPAYISFRRGRAVARGEGGQERLFVETRINKISSPGGRGGNMQKMIRLGAQSGSPMKLGLATRYESSVTQSHCLQITLA